MPTNNEVTYFAKTNFRNQDVVFGIKTDDRRRHMYIIGKTGMGKTTLLEHLVIQDIRNGHGVAYIDPHGDTAEKIITMIPPERINDVIYFNPADLNFPIAFNVIEKVPPEYRHLVASGLIGVFKKLWADSWGPRLEYILRNVVLALLEYPGSTLLGVMRILVDAKYRERVVDKITDPVVKAFWVDEFSKWSDKVLQEVVSPIQNKVGQFLSSSLIRNIVGQTKSSFNIREAMDQRKIIIMNLSKGHIGEDNSALIGAMMITKIQLAAMGRVDMPEEDRADFYSYVDEFQNFATESFANILSEARKYRLNLILANQYITQIIEEVRDAIFGNVGTMITFRVGATDAEFFEKEFEPVFVMNDIVNLPKFSVYLKLMIDGVAGDAFSAKTLAPVTPLAEGSSAEKVIQASRERYAKSKADVEEKIRRWSGMLSAEELAQIQLAANKSISRTGSENDLIDFLEMTPEDQKKMSGAAQGKTPATYASSPQLKEAQRVADRRLSDRRVPSPQNVSRPQEPRRDMRNDRPRTNDRREESKVQQRTAVTSQQPATVSQNARTEEIPPQPKSEKKLYDAKCDTCEADIQIPFVADGSRPTFCKDCLRDYQRAVAKARAQIEAKQFSPEERQAIDQKKKDRREQFKPQRVEQQRIYVPREAPLKMSQLEHMAPKKFRPLENTEKLPNDVAPSPASPIDDDEDYQRELLREER